MPVADPLLLPEGRASFMIRDSRFPLGVVMQSMSPMNDGNPPSNWRNLTQLKANQRIHSFFLSQLL